MLNRAVPGVIALCLAAVAPPGPVMGGSRAAGADLARTAAADLKVGTTARPAVVLPKSPVPAIDLRKAADAGVSTGVLQLALQATSCAISSGAIDAPRTLTLIDYSRPSVEQRLWVFNMTSGQLLFKELVAHGKNTGDNLATRFSNESNSLKSSLGLFVTDEPYFGSNGYSLRLDGLDVGFNDHARERAIVMHGAPYVDTQLGARQGRIGRSWGCPALSPTAAASVINTIRGGGVIFAYYPDQNWLTQSRFLRGCTTS